MGGIALSWCADNLGLSTSASLMVGLVIGKGTRAGGHFIILVFLLKFYLLEITSDWGWERHREGLPFAGPFS